MNADAQYARDPASLTGIIAEFEQEGYDGQFAVRAGGELECLSCHSTQGATSYSMHALRRTEGASDPADMAAVVALTCPSCDHRGTVVAQYGPEAGLAESEVLLALRDRREDDGVIVDPSIGPDAGPAAR